MIARLRRQKHTHEAIPGAVSGTARVDKRTKNLIARVQPGEIAIIDHEDIDRIAAEGLVQRQVRAVVNASRSSTGRYPNLGPLLLCSAGIPLVDEAGERVMHVGDGARIVIDEGRILSMNGAEPKEIGRGRVLQLEDVEKTLDVAKQSIATELERFAENTIGYIKDERDVLLEATRLPDVTTDFHHRHVLIVVRGYDYKEDLAALGAYIREVRPVLVGVDGGADALVDFGLKPDLIIGDMDSVTTECLLSGAELVVHAYAGGEAPGLERVEALGLDAIVFEATGTSEDIAMLLAYEKGAELIVAVGTHANMIEFMDKGRKGMASTFLTRLRVGPILVDAKGVGRLYRGRVRRVDLLMLVGAAILAMVVVIALSDVMRLQLELWWFELRQLWFDLQRALF
ncbi:MAG TPA: putative cytokinetic ring protein SteA [Actinomycetota bacterium]|nr:putative cytokinetic ring protein SteA [Actinomycetota bacterium]